MSDAADLLQWPAMAATILAAWMVASPRKWKRNYGFWTFLLSNVLWIAWGIWDGARALVVLQFCLAALNIRGAYNNRTKKADTGEGVDGKHQAAIV